MSHSNHTHSLPTQKKTVFSGMQPSCHLTLGNYLGALQHWKQLQQEYHCIFCVVDLHAITVAQDASELRDQIYQVLATYLAAGINPSVSSLFIQSHITQHTQLGWILSCFTTMGELSRMTQFKDKSSNQKNNGVGLFVYPTLMAADILLYQTHLVPVGEDQKQHLEITRDIALRMNHRYGEELFTLPEPSIPKTGSRIMSLQNPSQKMSKSDPNPDASLFLSDSNETILRKLNRAVTDSGSEITATLEPLGGVPNLLTIQASILDKTTTELHQLYLGKGYGVLKRETADLVIQRVAPVREELLRLLQEKTFLHEIIRQGAEKVSEQAEKTLANVQRKVGFILK